MNQLDPHAQSLPDHRWAGFRLIVVFAVVVISVGGWWLYSNGKEGSSVEPLRLSVLSLKELYPEALSIAREWQPGAFLHGVSFRILGADQTITSRATFYFVSSSGDLWLNVYIRGIFPDLEIETGEGEFPPDRPLPESIDPDELPFDSVDALKIILDSGAGQFMRTHAFQSLPPKLILERSGSYLSEGPLRWRAYFTGEDIHETEYFMVDAYTGAPLE